MISCVRSECNETATAGLAVQPPRREAWIVDWPDDPWLLSPICSEHAERLTVPTGWLLHDERGSAGSLFAERSVAERSVAERTTTADPTATVTRLDHRRARRQSNVIELTLFAEINPTPAADEHDISPGHDGEIAANVGSHDSDRPWIGDPDDRQSELLEVDATTPLLARAFRSSQAS